MLRAQGERVFLEAGHVVHSMLELVNTVYTTPNVQQIGNIL